MVSSSDYGEVYRGYQCLNWYSKANPWHPGAIAAKSRLNGAVRRFVGVLSHFCLDRKDPCFDIKSDFVCDIVVNCFHTSSCLAVGETPGRTWHFLSCQRESVDAHGRGVR